MVVTAQLTLKGHHLCFRIEMSKQSVNKAIAYIPAYMNLQSLSELPPSDRGPNIPDAVPMFFRQSAHRGRGFLHSLHTVTWNEATQHS